MSLSVSHIAAALSPSATLQLGALAAQMRSRGEPVLSMAAGEPDFDTPGNICDAAIRAIREGKTLYTAAEGLPALRRAICRRMQQEKQLTYTPDQIIVGAGAKQLLFEALGAIVDPGDEVILPCPCWLSYPEMIRMAGGTPVFVPTSAEGGYLPNPAQLEAAVSQKTKALIINTPCNPTGAVWPRRLLDSVMQIARRHDFFVIGDEIYEHLLYDGLSHVSPAQLSADARRRTVVISGFSKAFAMTGWRVGYAAGDRSVISAMTALQSHGSGCVNTIAQYAALEALEGEQQCVAHMANIFARRRELLLHSLSAEHLSPAFRPQGAFYLLLDVQPFFGRAAERAGITDDESLSRALLERALVAVTPGTPFGAAGHVRLSYAADEDTILHAVRRIGAFLRSLK